MKKLFSKARALFYKSRVLHYADVFLASFIVALGANKEHLLGAHGYNAWKSLVEAAAVVGGKAAIEAYRKSTQDPVKREAASLIETKLAEATASPPPPAAS
jgi:predicted short-subunit dehydrogenase-like oxidoreductase (DUF2520 family)